MRKLFIILSAVALFLCLCKYAFAVALLPFGGLVVSPSTPGIACVGTGPVIIKPYSISPVIDYYIAPGIPTGFGAAAPGTFILGLYSPIKVPTCALADGAPYPVRPVIMYGISIL